MTIPEYLRAHRDINDPRVYNDQAFPVAPRIVCKDGFSISVQASHGAYCSPRTNIAEWTKVECGFPSAEPTRIMEYAEQPEIPTQTVYGYVPVELVEKLLEDHGGIAKPQEAA